MTISACDALLGGMAVAVLGLAAGCITAWCSRHVNAERLERVEDAVETLRRESLTRRP